ncbi:hypothetical protein EG68_05433 [Paragonimus skrjabini miyazakii]|uniref:Uncharacterized protein n=1 Tax=Paragonimus skrjabini miyazakii TaxID=59628 RepID=A0A8S9YQ46_9TREM|nr:hypothetical protein EG68_05433 [Paragonimus skrjabini miyazakii]
MHRRHILHNIRLETAYSNRQAVTVTKKKCQFMGSRFSAVNLNCINTFFGFLRCSSFHGSFQTTIIFSVGHCTSPNITFNRLTQLTGYVGLYETSSSFTEHRLPQSQTHISRQVDVQRRKIRVY